MHFFLKINFQYTYYNKSTQIQLNPLQKIEKTFINQRIYRKYVNNILGT